MMMQSASEAVSLLSYPLYISLLAVGVGGVFLRLRFRWIGRAMIALGLGWTFVWSIPAASDWLRGTLEERHQRVAEQDLPAADAIVVLGGATRFRWLQRERVDPWELSSSRLAAGARAWLLHRAPIVILTGGRGPPGKSEATRMKHAIERLGVPGSAVVLEERSRNTEDNAANTARLLDELDARRVLLVTSSLHMPRSVLLFRRYGIDVVPVPVPEGTPGVTWRDRWIPSPRALWRSGRALKEHLALLALRVGYEREPTHS